MKITVGTIVWICCIGALAALSISAMSHKKDAPVMGLEVRIEQFDGGEYFLSEEDVYTKVSELLDWPDRSYDIRSLQTREVENILLENPFISRADVYVTSDGIINVNVRQREPVLRAIDRSGASFYVDRVGHKIPVSPYFTARVMVVTGNTAALFSEPAADSDPASDDSIMDLIRKIDDDPFMRSLTEQLEIAADGSVTLIPKLGDFNIALGAADNWDEKLLNLKAAYKQILNNGGWHKYKSLSLAYDGQVVCQLKPEMNK